MKLSSTWLLLLLWGVGGNADASPVTIVHSQFSEDYHILHFTPEDSTRYDTGAIWAIDKGRVATKRFEKIELSTTTVLLAACSVRPIPRDSTTMWDKWDRAGSIRMGRHGMPDLELIKFITPYGGPKTYVRDITHLKPYLEQGGTLKAFVDTWSSPGWEFTFEFWTRDSRGATDQVDSMPSDWVIPLIYEESITAEDQPDPVHVYIPEGTYRTELYYLVSGHCTDGRDADEFESKFNVVKVDGREVLRYKPWRNDCTRYRDINPYTRHWPDGTWSSDYSRSGWCPGDMVEPLVTDLRMDLPPGRHLMEFAVEDVRPRDENGHHGYWRVSAYLVGWEE